jgi:hypothetical protein
MVVLELDLCVLDQADARAMLNESPEMDEFRPLSLRRPRVATPLQGEAESDGRLPGANSTLDLPDSCKQTAATA